MKVCRKYLVSGRVQGVFFRDSTRAKALELGISGHARNLRDGRVEVLAYGEEPHLDALGAWLREGPAEARVAAVNAIDLGLEDIPTREGFEIH